MFSSIAFYIGEKVLGLNDREYPLGKLTAEVLNITPEEYHELQRMLDRAMDSMERYEEDRRMQDWFDANEEMILLLDTLCRHRIFRLIQEEGEILSEARTFTEQYSLFPEEDLELGERDREILAAIEAYEDYLEHPENYGGEDYIVYQFGDEHYTSIVPRTPVPPKPPEKTRALLIAYGPLNVKWASYKKYCMNYKRLLEDIASICQTLQAFVRIGLSSLEKLTPNNYMASLHEFCFMSEPISGLPIPWKGLDFTPT